MRPLLNACGHVYKRPLFLVHALLAVHLVCLLVWVLFSFEPFPVSYSYVAISPWNLDSPGASQLTVFRVLLYLFLCREMAFLREGEKQQMSKSCDSENCLKMRFNFPTIKLSIFERHSLILLGRKGSAASEFSMFASTREKKFEGMRQVGNWVHRTFSVELFS